MKTEIRFSKAGKFKDGIATLKVTEADVNRKKWFSVESENAVQYIDAGYAEMKKAKKPEKTKNIQKESK